MPRVNLEQRVDSGVEKKALDRPSTSQIPMLPSGIRALTVDTHVDLLSCDLSICLLASIN